MKMLHQPLLAFGLTLLASLSSQAEIITKSGWDYEQAEFRETDAEVAEERLENQRIQLTGWADYRFEAPESGWYELWFGGAPAEWNRDVYIDGETITRLGFSSQEDLDVTLPTERANIKELNVYLSKGAHTLRYQRYSFPGYLPFVWELRPSEGRPEGSIRLDVAGRRMLAVGEAVHATVIGGNAVQATEYEIFLVDLMTGEQMPVGRIDFPLTDQPIEKELPIPLSKVGIYQVLASVNGSMLRPSDLKGGYVMAVDDLGEPDRPSATKFSIAGLFDSGAVLQREKPLPVWGWCEPGQEVDVTFAGITESTRADANGRWQVTFPDMAAGGPYELVAECEGETIKNTDILVGEVWLLSGQSNMGGPILQSTGGIEVAREAHYPNLRMASVYNNEVDNGDNRLRVGWQDADSGGDPERLKNWLGIHLGFGIKVHEALGVPVGLVRANRGGTYISTWSSMDLHRSLPNYKAYLEGYESIDREHINELVHLTKTAGGIRKWKSRVEAAKEAGKAIPKEPRITSSMKIINGPAMHWDGLIEPMIPFAMRGVLWYQGESDSSMAKAYRERFPAMIESWRAAWNEPNWPFFFVQIAYGKGVRYEGEPGDFQGAELKEAQLMTLSLPNTAMVVTDDLMTPEDQVHYHDKLPVGYRLARAALAKVYGFDIEYSGPIYRAMEIEGDQVRLSFDHADGLQAKGGQLGGFAIAGADHKWVWANAKIDGSFVVVSHPDVSEPKAVRYSWAERPSGGNLVNAAGLPAAVFRTDDWPMVTEGVDWLQKN